MAKHGKLFAVVVLIILSILGLLLLFKAGMTIPYETQSSYFDNVRTIASIIFGVTGAWLAVTYPKALHSAKAAKDADSRTRNSALIQATEDTEILIGFVTTMIISIVIIAISLTIPFIKEILSLSQWATNHSGYLRGGMYSLLAVISVVQIGLLVSALKNTYKALTDLHRNTAEAITRAERDKNREN